MSELRRMPIVGGGERHGTVLEIEPHHSAYFVVDSSADLDDYGLPAETTRTLLDVQKVWFILPGRTDRQIFRVLIWPDGGEDNLADAVLKAWADGWAPPDSTSETWAPDWGAFHPGVALAVADWLDAEADFNWVPHPAALAVARALLPNGVDRDNN